MPPASPSAVWIAGLATELTDGAGAGELPLFGAGLAFFLASMLYFCYVVRQMRSVRPTTARLTAHSGLTKRMKPKPLPVVNEMEVEMDD